MATTRTCSRPAPPASGALPRPRGLLVLAAVAAVALPGAVWLAAADPGPQHATGPVAVVRQIGPDRTAALGAAGPVRLRVDAEVPADAPATAAVPAGAPVTLTFTLPPGTDAASAALSARHEPSAAASGTPLPPAAVDLTRGEVFLVDRAGGALVLPSYGAAGATHEHGAALTRGMPAGGLAWATSVAPRAAATAADPAGRWFAAAPADRAQVELVDLARREPPAAAGLPAPATGTWFDPAGRLWAATPAGLVAVDPVARTAAAPLPTGGVADVAFTADGSRGLATGPGGTHLLDPQARTVVGAAPGAAAVPPVAGEPVAVAFAPAAGPAGGFVVAARGGLTLLPLTADGGLGTALALPYAPVDPATVEVGPDGRSAVVTDRARSSTAVVDLVAGAVTRTVPAPAPPSEVVFLEGFAVVRTDGTDATWIDLADPTKNDDVTLGSAAPGAFAVSADGTEVLAPVPADGRVFRLHVMMGRPMVMASDDNPIGADAVVAVASTLHEGTPGTLVQRTVLADPGTYRLRLAVGAAVAEFAVEVAAPPAPPVLARPDGPALSVPAGMAVTVRFTADADLSDPEVLAYADTPAGPRQVRAPATRDGAGAWTATFTPPAPGRYLVHLLAPDAGLTTTTGRPATVDAT